MRAVALDLLIGRDSAKHDFCKLSTFEWPIGDSSASTISIHAYGKAIVDIPYRPTYPTTSKGFFTIAMDR
jgi:hypothetical protein